MAPEPVTEDYYMVLEVEHTATPELVTQSYIKLTLKLHQNWKINHDVTEDFQLLERAYDTLEDESKRRAYDSIFPTIIQRSPSPQTRTPPTSTSRPALSEAAQIAALEKSKLERSARWLTEKKIFDSSIFELQKEMRQLEQEIKNLVSIAAAEAEVEAQKYSWTTWLLSPIYKKVEDTEEEQEHKDRARQERKIEKDFKETKIQVIKERIWTRKFDEEQRERKEKERVERERAARIWKQEQEQREKDRAERVCVARFWEQLQEQHETAAQQAEERAADQKRHEGHARDMPGGGRRLSMMKPHTGNNLHMPVSPDACMKPRKALARLPY